MGGHMTSGCAWFVTFSRCPPQCKKPATPKTTQEEVDLQPGDVVYAAFIPEEWATAQI